MVNFLHLLTLIHVECSWKVVDLCRVWQCSQGENQCQAAAETGVSILHGNALAFVKASPAAISYLTSIRVVYLSFLSGYNE